MKKDLNKKDFSIEEVHGLEVLDSRGNPTVEVTVRLGSGASGKAIVPSGASTGRFEAVELRDEEKRFGGKGVERAVTNVNTRISDRLCGCNALEQREIDHILKEADGEMFCELRAQTAPGMGVAIAGRLSQKGIFKQEYYFPYVESSQVTSTADCSIQRHTERETFAGLLDEYRVGISLIFYIENSLEYRLRLKNSQTVLPKSASLSALSVHGKILLPVQKTPKQAENRKKAASKRSRLIEAAKRGDEEAIETLTVEDIDLFSSVSRRVAKEDIYSIVDTCFMPSGIECDQYSVIGNILSADRRINRITGEEIFLLGLECNDMIFTAAINAADLLGEPAPGRRFKGQVWMQGTVGFKA